MTEAGPVRLAAAGRDRKFREIERQARKRLRWLDAATSLADLSAIRGNRLQALRRDRAGQCRIRITDRWRICFVWHEAKADGVEIVGIISEE